MVYVLVLVKLKIIRFSPALCTKTVLSKSREQEKERKSAQKCFCPSKLQLQLQLNYLIFMFDFEKLEVYRGLLKFKALIISKLI